MEIKKILVPVDFSQRSEDALKIAAQIAKKTGAEIILLHLIDLPSNEVGMFQEGVPTGPAAIVLMESARDNFERLLSKDYLEGIQVEDFVDFNKPFEGISEYAEDKNVDLIVMGSHGVTGLDSFFVGSNTEKVVRTSRVPVLVVKKPVEEFDLKKVVFASSFKDECHQCFARLVKFVEIYDPEVKLLRVNTITNFLATHESEDLISGFLKKHVDLTGELRFEKVIYDDYSVQQGIFNYADKIDADLIALATHGRQGLMHFLQDSIAEDVVNKANRNILTFRIEKK